MDVHLPKPLHGWRAFAGEVGVIVLGVLIALGVQQLADAWQWREKVSRAENSMRIELAEDNGPQAYGRILIGNCLDQQITRIRTQAGNVPTDQLRQWIADYSPPFRTWDSEAWKAVVASDVGSHMGSDRLVAWSAPYRFMPQLSDRDERQAELVMQMRATLPPSGEPSPADLQSLRQTAGQLQLINGRFVRSAQLLLKRIGVVGATVPLPIQRELTAEARKIYGGCVTVPDQNAVPRAQLLIADLKSLY